MTDAKTQFFVNMERELLESFDGPTTTTSSEQQPPQASSNSEIDITITESGRTVVEEVGGGENFTSNLDKIIEESAAAAVAGSAAAGGEATTTQQQEQDQQQHSHEGFDVDRPPPMTKSIPVPPPMKQPHHPVGGGDAGGNGSGGPSNPSSYGSSGSAFMNSLLNSNMGVMTSTFNGAQLSHTPPTKLATSYEAAHFCKRARSGSVSGRLRSASEYLEDKGLLDRQTKSLLKDLIIIGDEELQEALDLYETAGDPSALEQMISSGALQQRLPTDLDLMNDIDLDFLTVNDDNKDSMHQHLHAHDTNIEEIPGNNGSAGHHHQQQQQQQHGQPNTALRPPQLPSAAGGGGVPSHQHQQQAGGAPQQQQQQNSRQPAMISPPQYDDGIGDLDFNELVEDHGGGHHHHHDHHDNNNNAVDYVPHNQQHQQFGVIQPTAAGGGKQAPLDSSVVDNTSPATTSTLQETDHERRMRSNSLFSALLSVGESQMTRNRGDSFFMPAAGDGGAGGGATNPSNTAAVAAAQPPPPPAQKEGSNDWMEQYLEPVPSTATSSMQGIEISKGPKRRPKLPGNAGGGGIGASLMEAEVEAAAAAPAGAKNTKKKKTKKGRKEKAKKDKEKANKSDGEEREEHVPGSGRPRTLSDPNLLTSHDEFGLRQVERPDGWVGAYSPDSRKVRIAKFLEKRNHRVWNKTIKYDVRKNFADSRLRVKGRFVKKEDELLMRELMSLT